MIEKLGCFFLARISPHRNALAHCSGWPNVGVYGTDTQVFLETSAMLPERHAKIRLFKHFSFLSMLSPSSPPLFFLPLLQV